MTAGLAGPVLGGILAEHFHWSIIFWINVPLGLVAALMASQDASSACRATTASTSSTCSAPA